MEHAAKRKAGNTANMENARNQLARLLAEGRARGEIDERRLTVALGALGKDDRTRVRVREYLNRNHIELANREMGTARQADPTGAGTPRKRRGAKTAPEGTDPDFEISEEELAQDPAEALVRESRSRNSASVYDDDGVRMYLAEIGQYPLLTAEEELALARRVQAGDERAKEEMINHNLRLVVAVAKKFLGRGVSLLDLIQDGSIGLMKAVERFDPSLGNRFSTYATWWIRQGIMKNMGNYSRTIHVPVHVLENANRVEAQSKKMEDSLGRKPTDEELARQMHLSVSNVRFFQSADKEVVSLDAPASEDNEANVGDLIGDSDAKTPEELVTDSDLRWHLFQLLKMLTPQERRVVILRYGLMDGQERTLEEVGRELRLTRERIRQIERQAMQKLQVPSHQRGLGLFLG